MTTKRLLGGLAVCAIAAATAVGTATAQGNDARETYKMMHGAIIAAEQCGVASLSREDHVTLAQRIDREVNFDLGAGERLTAIEETKFNVKKAVLRRGCDSDQVQDMLATYNSQLAPALQ